MSDEEKQEWDRKPPETSRGYELFCTYRDMGIERSLTKARASANGMPSLARLKQVCKRWNWVERCQKYDDHLEYQDRIQHEKERREMNKRHAKMGRLAQSFAVRKLEKMINKIETDKDQDPASPSQVAHILEVGVKVERLAMGEATESQELSGPGGGPVRLSLKETLARIRESYGLAPEEEAVETRRASDGTGTPDPKL